MRNPGRDLLRLSLSLMGVLLLATVFFSGVAHAEGEWAIEEEALSSAGSTSVPTETAGTATFVLVSKVLGSPFKLSCTTESSTGSVVAKGTAADEISLSGCTASEPAGCTVGTPIVFKLHSEPTEIEEVLYEVFAPGEGSVLSTIKLSGCAAAGSYQLKGKLAAQIPQFGVEQTEQSLTFSAAISTAAGVSLTLGKEPATLQGGAKRRLAVPNFGKNFGPIPIRPKVRLLFPKTVFPNVATIKEEIGIAPKTKVKFAVIQIVGGGGVFSKEMDGCSGNEIGGGGAEAECAVTFKFTPPNAPAEKFLGWAVVAWEVAPKGQISGITQLPLVGES